MKKNENESRYTIMPTGKEINTMVKIVNTNLTMTSVSGVYETNATKGIFCDEVQYELMSVATNLLSKRMPLSAHRLLLYMGTKARKTPNDKSSAKITVTEYAKLLGLNPDDLATRNEVQKELKELSELLRYLNIHWKGAKRKGVLDTCVVSAYEYKNGVFEIYFSQKYIDYIKKMPLTHIHNGMFQLQLKDSVSYAIAYKLCIHASISKNIKTGTNHILSLGALHDALPIMSIEEVNATDQSWKAKIKKPISTALDRLVECGILNNYHFERSDHTPIDIDTIKSYAIWQECYLVFELSDQEQIKTLRAKRTNKNGAVE